MSEKPQSAFKRDFWGNRPVSSMIDYEVVVDGKTYRIFENIDTSLNGNTGLPLTITARAPEKVQNVYGNYVYNDFDALTNPDITNAILNSSDREQIYHTRMNELRVKSLESGTSEQFEKNLVDNGVYEAIAGSGSINDVKLTTKKSRNEEENIKKIEKLENKRKEEEAAAERYKEAIQVKNEVLYYPSNLETTRGEDYIFIEQFEYSPPQPKGTVNLVPEEGKPSALTKGIGRSTNIVRDDKGIEEPRGSCKLPIPNKLGVSNGVSWGEAKANAVELAAFDATASAIGDVIGGAKNIGDVLKEGYQGGGKIFNELRNQFKNTSGFEANSASIVSAALARATLSSFGINVDVDQFITRQTGAAINPNLELLFGGPQLRTFSFNFNFAPENETEAVMVRKIQRWFRQGMLPTRSYSGADSRLFLGSPNVFRIQYKNMSRRIKGLNIIKICALTSCQIDFTPDGTYQSYDDSESVSMPVRSTMGLTFNELTPIFRDDYVPNSKFQDQSVKDLGTMVTGIDAINEHDIGF